MAKYEMETTNAADVNQVYRNNLFIDLIIFINSSCQYC